VTTYLADTMWPDLAAGSSVLVPVGSVEQHGPHLPLDTDVVIAEAVTRRVAELLTLRGGAEPEEVIVAPPICYGASGEHQAFPGTSSIGTEALRTVLIEVTRSVRTWADRVVFINAHGGNIAALQAAISQLVAEGHPVRWLPCRTEKVDAHAGRTETSLLLHLCPGRVRLDRIQVGNTTPIAELLDALVAQGVRTLSENGVLGDPTGASAAEGHQVMEEMAAWIFSCLQEAPK
jgi:creatinine amidohydrolase